MVSVVKEVLGYNIKISNTGVDFQDQTIIENILNDKIIFLKGLGLYVA